MNSEHSKRQSSALHGGAVKNGKLRPRGLSPVDVAKLGRHLRGLVDGLMRDMLAAITAASAAEIEVVIGDLAASRRLERTRPQRPARDEARPVSPRHNGVARAAGRAPGRALGSEQRTEGGDRPRLSQMPQSPFDITSPGDLLASVMMHAAAPAEERARPQISEPAAAPPAPRPDRASSPLLAHGPASPPAVPSAADIEAASERRPRVVLREGERLLSATGSGVVIRRERRVAPQR